MKTKKSLLPEVYQDLCREEELEASQIHIIDTGRLVQLELLFLVNRKLNEI